MMQLVIGWTCVGVFIATAVITLLAVTRIIRLADKKYLDRLFYALMVEVVVVGVGVWAQQIKIEGPGTVANELKNEGRLTGQHEGRLAGQREGREAAVAELQSELARLNRTIDQKNQLIPQQAHGLSPAQMQVLQQPLTFDPNVIEHVKKGTFTPP